ncbi:type II toxin-antitoxin system PemK/MazF family toxin, partial [Candidatus Woesearchaeota archaeon]|nr:type II toxin-antitoxin system PemK/MazF family toxin [Candidatus Woesearchaeota archaeon]
MERPLRGDVVVVPFPFSDLMRSTRRPALVVASLSGDDLILCQITSQARMDRYAIPLLDRDFQSGSLRVRSVIRPNRLFTADRSLILYRAGTLRKRKMQEVQESLVSIFT